MGWDIHFTNQRTIGEILEDKEFDIEFKDDDAYVLTTDEEGHKSGLIVPGVTKDNYKTHLLSYGFISYNCRLGEFLWKLYTKYDMWFADTALDDFMYLCDECKNEEEENALLKYCYAEEMVHFFGDNLPKDDKLRKILADTTPVRDRLYEQYMDKHKRK